MSETMYTDLNQYGQLSTEFDRSFIELLILRLGDLFNIRIEWNRESAVVTGAFAVAGGFIGGYSGGRLGAAIGAGLGGVTGIGVRALVTLREIWSSIRDQLQELMFIVFNFLRRLDPIDYINAIELVMACSRSRVELATTILEFIAQKLGRVMLSTLTAP